MNVTVIEDLHAQQWDDDLSMFSASPFITAGWLESFRTARRVPIYFRFVAEGKTVGLIAGLILEPSHALLRRIERRIFFFSGPAVLQSDPELIRTCVLSLINYATVHGYTSLELKSWDYPYTYDLGSLPFYQETREELIIDLRGDWGEIQKKISRMIKRHTKYALSNGVTFHESHAAHIIEDLIALMDETKSIRRAKGYEDYSSYYLPYLDQEVIYRLFEKKIARIFYGQRQEKIICVLLTIVSHKRAYALLIGSNAEAYELQAPGCIYFNTIRTLKEDNIESFNLGGVPNDAGASNLRFFKMLLGPEKHACTSGATAFLQGRFYNLLHQVYDRKLSVKTIKKVLGI